MKKKKCRLCGIILGEGEEVTHLVCRLKKMVKNHKDTSIYDFYKKMYPEKIKEIEKNIELGVDNIHTVI